MTDTLVAALAVAAGAVAQWLTGLGFGLVAAPFLVTAFGQAEGVRTSILLGAAVNVVLLAERRHDVRPPDVALLLVPGVLATPVVAALVAGVDARALAAAAGALTVAGAALLAAGVQAARLRGRRGAVGAAVASAAMNVIAGVGGPPVALFTVNAGWSPLTARATLQAYFLGMNVVALAVLGLPELRPVLAVGLVAGAVVGRRLVRRVPEHLARIAVLAVAAAGGVVAIARAVS